MANPTSETLSAPALIETSISPGTVPIDPTLAYNLMHTGKNASTDDTADIFISGGTTAPTPSYASSSNKGVLKFGDPPMPIGPGLEDIAFITASGTPRFQLIPIARYV